MNILFVADVSIANVIGGAERVLFEQSTRLAQRGHNVHILTRKLPTHAQNQKVIQGVREWRYDIDKKSTISFLKTTWQNSRRLFESIHNQYGFDCINFHQPFSSLGIIQSKQNKRISKIYTCHSLSFEEFISRNVRPNGYLDRIFYFLNIHIRKWIEKRVITKSDEIITLSEYTQDKLWRTYNIPFQKITIIPGGVDLDRFQPVKEKKEIRRRLNIPPEKVVLFTVRNLVPRMGLENLIFAIREVVKTSPDIYIVIGGEGGLKVDLINMSKKLGVKKNIHFTGFISDEELASYYAMADLFILPTRELEGFGLVTLEAMASGVPVLGTPVGGTKEILGSFNPNFLFKDTSPDSIAALIAEKYRTIKENPKKWADILLQCRKFVESKYSWEKNVDALENIFGRL